MSSKRAVTALAWFAGALSLACFAAAWMLAARNHDLADLSSEFGPDRFFAAYAAAGTLLASRRRSNPVGWLLLGLGLVTALRGLAGEYARYALAGPHHPGHPGGVWAAWYVGWSLIVLFPAGLLTYLLLLFPDGRPLTRRWWVVFWCAVGTCGTFLVMKYRLYAIDRIISRTVSYVLVTGLVVGVYLGCVALLTRVLPVRGSVGVAVSVLAAAALFAPLRRRVQITGRPAVRPGPLQRRTGGHAVLGSAARPGRHRRAR